MKTILKVFRKKKRKANENNFKIFGNKTDNEMKTILKVFCKKRTG